MEMSAGNSKCPITRTLWLELACGRVCGLAGVRNQLAQHAVCLAIHVFWLPTRYSTGLVFVVGGLGGDLGTNVVVLEQTQLTA